MGPELHQEPELLLQEQLRLHWLVSTTGAWNAPQRCLGQQKALLLPDVSKLQLPELNLDVNNYRILCFSWTWSHYSPVTWTCLHNRGLSCTWICLDNRSLCCSLDLSTYFTSHRTELHLDIYKIPEAYAVPGQCLHHKALSKSILWCTWKCLDLFGQQEPVLLLKVFTALAAPAWTAWTTGTFAAPECMCPQGPELRLDFLHYTVACANLVVSRIHKSVLLLNVSTVNYRGIWCTWTCLYYRGLIFNWDAPVQQEPVLLLDVNFAFLKSWILPLKGCRNKHLAFLYRKTWTSVYTGTFLLFWFCSWKTSDPPFRDIKFLKSLQIMFRKISRIYLEIFAK